MLCGPAACGCCGHDLTGEPVLGTVQKRQVFEASPPPPPTVTEYQVAAKQCPECGEVSVGLAPAGVTGRVQYGPGVHAKAALAVCAHYLPVARAARLVAALTGVNVSAGFVAGIRGKAARLLAPFMDRVRELLHAAPVLYADETPARAAGNTALRARGVHRVPHRHAHRRPDQRSHRRRRHPARLRRAPSSATATRDMSTSPTRCTPGAARTGCATWPGCTASTPTARSGPGPWPTCSSTPTPPPPPPAPPARPASATPTSPASGPGTAAPSPRASPITSTSAPRSAKDGLRLARRFRDHEDMILRFATDLAVGFTSNQAERDIRPVKVQQRTSGGTWRTLLGLADFAIVQSYLSTAAKWGIDALDALTRLFTDGPWLPPATAPP